MAAFIISARLFSDRPIFIGSGLTMMPDVETFTDIASENTESKSENQTRLLGSANSVQWLDAGDTRSERVQLRTLANREADVLEWRHIRTCWYKV